jgi:hypothetical protein
LGGTVSGGETGDGSGEAGGYRGIGLPASRQEWRMTMPVYVVIAEAPMPPMGNEYSWGVHTILDVIQSDIESQEQINRLYQMIEELYHGRSYRVFLFLREPANPFREFKRVEDDED